MSWYRYPRWAGWRFPRRVLIFRSSAPLRCCARLWLTESHGLGRGGQPRCMTSHTHPVATGARLWWPTRARRRTGELGTLGPSGELDLEATAMCSIWSTDASTSARRATTAPACRGRCCGASCWTAAQVPDRAKSTVLVRLQIGGVGWETCSGCQRDRGSRHPR